MILDIRGTHGSGKSWIMRVLLAAEAEGTDPSKLAVSGRAYPNTKLDHPEIHLGYKLPQWDAFLLGRYVTDCGGCDGIKTADEVCRRVRRAASIYRHVLLEGILVAHTFQRYSDLASDMEEQGHPYVFCFLNTPLKTCVARVRSRRRRRGDSRTLNPGNVIRDHARIWRRLRAQCVEAGHRTVELPWRDPLPVVLDLLEGRMLPMGWTKGVQDFKQEVS